MSLENLSVRDTDTRFITRTHNEDTLMTFHLSVCFFLKLIRRDFCTKYQMHLGQDQTNLLRSVLLINGNYIDFQRVSLPI